MHKLRMMASAAVLALASGCATTSFAPPMVSTNERVEASGRCTEKIGWKGAVRQDTIEGAQQLIDNFLHAYRCAANETANGRRIFEIPAYLGLAGTTTAVAFGAGPGVALAGGANAAILSSGNSYFDPKGKAIIFNKAMDALVCIQSESNGVPAYDPKLDPPKVAADGSADSTLEGEVQLSWEKQYFKVLSGALLSVETVARERLRSSGTYNPEGLVAEIGVLQAAATKAREEAEAKRNGTAPAAPPPPGEDVTGGAADGIGELTPEQKKQIAAENAKGRLARLEAANAASAAVGRQKHGYSTIKLDVMRAQLQLCVVRAKV